MLCCAAGFRLWMGARTLNPNPPVRSRGFSLGRAPQAVRGALCWFQPFLSVTQSWKCFCAQHRSAGMSSARQPWP